MNSVILTFLLSPFIHVVFAMDQTRVIKRLNYLFICSELKEHHLYTPKSMLELRPLSHLDTDTLD